MNSFERAFRPALRAFEKVAGESWIYAGGTWPAIEIDDLSLSQDNMKGGIFANATLVLTVRHEVVEDSGLTANQLIQARGQVLRVIGIGAGGDGAIVLTCGPAGVRTT